MPYNDLDEELEILTSPALYKVGTEVYARAKTNRTSVGLLSVGFIETVKIRSLLGGYAAMSARRNLVRRVKAKLPENAVIGRGADSLIILLEGYDKNGAFKIAEAIADTINNPYIFNDYKFEMRPHITVCEYPGGLGYTDTNNVTRIWGAFIDICHERDTQICVMNSDDLFIINEKQRIDQEMFHAIDRNEFYLEYQPRMDMRTGKIIGCEALLRWGNSELGNLSPAVFIPRAEVTGVIHSITSWVITTAGLATKELQKKYGPDFTTGINLSPANIRSPDMLETISTILTHNEISPQSIDFEITESLMLEDSNIAINLLSTLRKDGIKTALDDFGTGFSSLSMLTRLPLDYLKIDQSFIQRLDQPNNEQDIKVTKAIRDLGEACGLQIIAEGMETKQQVDVLLNDINVSIGQGYYFGYPTSIEEFVDTY